MLPRNRLETKININLDISKNGLWNEWENTFVYSLKMAGEANSSGIFKTNVDRFVINTVFKVTGSRQENGVGREY